MGLSRLGQMPPSVPPDASVLDAVQCMVAAHVGAITVSRDRKLLGVFTERDLMKRVVARGKDPATTPIGEVMTANVRSVTDDMSVSGALQIMRAGHFRHLPVVDADGEVLGMVALRFLLYHLMEDLEAKVGDLEGYYLMEDSHGG